MTCTCVSLSQMVTPLICLRLNPQVSQLPFILHSNCQSFPYNYSFSIRPSYIRSPDSPVRPRSGVVMLPSYMHRRHVPTCTLFCSAFGPAAIRSPDHQFGREAASWHKLCKKPCVLSPVLRWCFARTSYRSSTNEAHESCVPRPIWRFECMYVFIGLLVGRQFHATVHVHVARPVLLPYCNSDVMLRRSLALRSANGGEFMPAILLHLFGDLASERLSHRWSQKKKAKKRPISNELVINTGNL